MKTGSCSYFHSFALNINTVNNFSNGPFSTLLSKLCFRTFGICLFFEANVLKDSQFFKSTYYSFNTGGTQANRTSVCLYPKTKIKTMP